MTPKKNITSGWCVIGHSPQTKPKLDVDAEEANSLAFPRDKTAGFGCPQVADTDGTTSPKGKSSSYVLDNKKLLAKADTQTHTPPSWWETFEFTLKEYAKVPKDNPNYFVRMEKLRIFESCKQQHEKEMQERDNVKKIFQGTIGQLRELAESQGLFEGYVKIEDVLEYLHSKGALFIPCYGRTSICTRCSDKIEEIKALAQKEKTEND